MFYLETKTNKFSLVYFKHGNQMTLVTLVSGNSGEKMVFPRKSSNLLKNDESKQMNPNETRLKKI